MRQDDLNPREEQQEDLNHVKNSRRTLYPAYTRQEDPLPGTYSRSYHLRDIYSRSYPPEGHIQQGGLLPGLYSREAFLPGLYSRRHPGTYTAGDTRRHIQQERPSTRDIQQERPLPGTYSRSNPGTHAAGVTRVVHMQQEDSSPRGVTYRVLIASWCHLLRGPGEDCNNEAMSLSPGLGKETITKRRVLFLG